MAATAEVGGAGAGQKVQGGAQDQQRALASSLQFL